MALIEYIYWHYGIAPAGILELLKNYLIGTWHRFLIGTHFKTLLSPWHRARPSDTGTAQNFGDKILNGIVDFYITIAAAVIRLLIILIGLAAEVIIIIVFLVLFIGWLLWPVIFIWSVNKGLAMVL